MQESHTTVGRQSSREILPLTGLRFFAATWVLLFHGQVVALSFLGTAFRLGDPVVRSGSLGVDVFFVLSGFILTYTYIERLGPSLQIDSYFSYLQARVSRIWPAFFVVLNLSGIWLFLGSRHHSVLAWSLQARSPDFTFNGWLSQVLLAHQFFRPYTDGACWFGPGWTISAEMVAYLLFPGLAVILWRIKHIRLYRLALLSVCFIAPVALVRPLTNHNAYEYSWLVRITGCFTAGAFAYLITKRVLSDDSLHRRYAWSRILIVLVCASLAALWCLPTRWSACVVIFLIPVLIVTLTLDSSGTRPCIVTRVLSSRTVVYGGRISYSLYLIHMLVFYVYFWAQRSVPALHARTGLGAVFAVFALTLPFALAHLLYRYVEDPARKWLQQAGRAESTAALNGTHSVTKRTSA